MGVGDAGEWDMDMSSVRGMGTEERTRRSPKWEDWRTEIYGEEELEQHEVI